MKKVIILCILLISSGCQSALFSERDYEEANASQEQSTISRILNSVETKKSYEATMSWKHTDTTTWSLCGAQIDAQLHLDLEVKDKDIIGSGDITYTRVNYNEQRMCTDCLVTGSDTPVRVRGLVKNDSIAEIEIILEDDLEETQSSEQCFQETQYSHILEHSFQQAGIFQTLSIKLPDTSPTTTDFSWNVGDQSGDGVLKVTKK